MMEVKRPAALIARNDRVAYFVIAVLSIVVFAAVALLKNGSIHYTLSFDAHVFATANAFINSTVSILLLVGLWLVRKRKYIAHRNIMFAAVGFSALFLLSYIAHHLFCR